VRTPRRAFRPLTRSLFLLLVLLVGGGVARAAGVEVVPFQRERDAVPGEFVSLALSLTSREPAPGEYVVRVVAPPAWGAIGEGKTVLLQPDSPRTLFFTLLVPSDAPAGKVTVEVLVEPVGGGALSGHAAVVLSVAPREAFEVTPPSPVRAAPGEGFLCSFTLRNRGNVPVALTVRAESDLDLLSPSTPAVVLLARGEERVIEVEARVPQGFVRSASAITLSACAEGGACQRGTALVSILPLGPEEAPGIPHLLFPAEFSLAMEGGGAGSGRAQGAFRLGGTLPGGIDLELSLTLSGTTPLRITVLDLAAAGLAGGALGAGLAVSGASTSLRLDTGLAIGSLALVYEDAHGAQTPGQTLALRYAVSPLPPLLLRGDVIGSRSAGETDASVEAAASLETAGTFTGTIPVLLRADAEGRHTGPGFYGGNRDTRSLSAGLDLRTEEAATGFWRFEQREKDVLDSASVKGYAETTLRAGLLGSFLDLAAYRTEWASAKTEWEDAPVENGWREKRDEEERWVASFELRTETISCSFCRSTRDLLLDGVRDDDGDGLFDEDPVNGLDDEGDGRVDEDAVNHDEFTIEESGFGTSVHYGATRLEVGFSDSETRAGDPISGPIVDASSVWRFALALDVSEALSTQISAAIEGHVWEYVLALRYQPPGAETTAGAHLALSSVEVGPGAFEQRVRIGVDFESRFLVSTPFVAQGQVEGVAFVDENADGRRDVGEKGVAGLVLRLGPVRARTDSSGRYRFPPINPGEYAVEIEGVPLGLREEKVPPQVTVVRGETVSLSLPFQPVGWISGVAFEDTNANGVRDAGEAGVESVRLVLMGGERRGATLTGQDGRFSFPNLAPGSYSLEVDPSSRAARTVLTTPSPLTLSVSVGTEARAVFGLHRTPRPVVVTFRAREPDFTYERAGGALSVTLVGESPFPPGTSTTYRWDLNGDGVADAEGERVTVTFPAPGTYPVTLTVTSGAGETRQATKPVPVEGK
jgi:hypothetical protein